MRSAVACLQVTRKGNFIGVGSYFSAAVKPNQLSSKAKAGQNDCANLAGTHSCAGQSKVDADKGEWKYVAAGTCNTMKGLTADEAKKANMKS